jgi:small subunit ribosomal protein S8
MLTRIRNAILVRKKEIQLPHSRSKESIANLLKANGFIQDVKVIDASIGKTLQLVINDEHENARISEIQRLSKPGRRFYVKSKDIPVVKRGRGIVIVSTSRGLMTGTEAREAKVGGELICKVY